MKNDYILYLDMDGVLTNFDLAFKRVSGGISPDEFRKLNKKSGEASLFLNQGPEFWSEMEWIEGGKELVNFALSHFQLVRILSSSGTGNDDEKYKKVKYGKTQWLKKHIPEIKDINIIIVPFYTLKAKYSNSNSILIDDKAETIDKWNLKGGTGILHHHLEWKETILSLKTLSQSPIKLKELIESF